MNAIVANFIDTMLTIEQTDPTEENEETVVAEENPNMGHEMNTFFFAYS